MYQGFICTFSRSEFLVCPTPSPVRKKGKSVDSLLNIMAISQSGTRKVTMKIHGVSQSSGTERQLTIERGIDGVVLTIVNSAIRKECGRIIVAGETLVGAILEPRKGGTAIEGLSSPQNPKMILDVEVRRNEVLLTVQPGATADIAVGLDDLQDALEGVISRS
jgi:hypothetical protein